MAKRWAELFERDYGAVNYRFLTCAALLWEQIGTAELSPLRKIMCYEQAGRLWTQYLDLEKENGRSLDPKDQIRAVRCFLRAAELAPQQGDTCRSDILWLRAVSVPGIHDNYGLRSEIDQSIKTVREARRTVPLDLKTGGVTLKSAGVQRERPVILFVNSNSALSNHPLERLYRELPIYVGADLFAPPSEKRPHILRLVLTQGCQYGACTFCGGYQGLPASTLTPQEFRAHVDEVFKFLEGANSHSGFYLRKVFIGSGDAFSVPTTRLLDALEYTRQAYQRAHWFRNVPESISLYARTSSVLKKTPQELKALRKAGVRMVYVGFETGSDALLKYVKKGQSRWQTEQAITMLHEAGIVVSAMVISGLGGARFYQDHIVESAALLSRTQPRYVTFMGINVALSSAYARMMHEEMSAGTNRPLTPEETVSQVSHIIDRTEITEATEAGSFPADIDCVGQNPLTFSNTHLHDKDAKKRLAADLRLRSRIIGATPSTMIKVAVRALAGFVADETENILLRVSAAQALWYFGSHALEALPVLEAFVNKYPVEKAMGGVKAVMNHIHTGSIPSDAQTNVPPTAEAIAHNFAITRDIPNPLHLDTRWLEGLMKAIINYQGRSLVELWSFDR
ncbi:MAG: radical SAM protein [Deltaproteobacteria bacterium]|nr:radical SAM protein [Deltaproteobacteria bacterium]